MAEAYTVTPSSGVVHGKTVVRIDCTGLSSNDTSSFDRAKYPTEPEIRYYVKAAATGQPTLKSYQFASAPGGTHSFNGLIFPGAATWTVTINKVSDDSAVATDTVSVA